MKFFSWLARALGITKQPLEDLFIPVRQTNTRVELLGGQRIFYIDIGDLPPKEAFDYLDQWRTRILKPQ